MNFNLKLNPNKLSIFHEGRKRRIYVGEVIYHKDKDRYELIYDRHYANLKNAIPISPDLTLFKLHHRSTKGKMFSALLDRIPDPDNPAYKDYCQAMGIAETEKNPIILLGTIGTRGPSSFIFEPVYDDNFVAADITELRENLGITQHDMAVAFDISKPTLQRIESGESHDLNTLKRIQIMLNFPEVALWQLKQTGSRVHVKARRKLESYFEKRRLTCQALPTLANTDKAD